MPGVCIWHLLGTFGYPDEETAFGCCAGWLGDSVPTIAGDAEHDVLDVAPSP